MACLTFIQIQRKGSVHPIRVSRAFLIKAGGEGWVGGGWALCLCAVTLGGIGASEQPGSSGWWCELTRGRRSEGDDWK